MGNKKNQKKPRAAKKPAAPPPYDEQTHLSALVALRDTWMRAGNVSKAAITKLEDAMQKRLVPNNHPDVDATTPLSKLLDIVDRFKRKREKHAFNFKPRDEAYLKRVKGMVRGRKGKDTRNKNLEKKLAQTRPTITDETDMETLETLREELVKKKLKFPDQWKGDEREYLKKVKLQMAKLRRADTMAALPRVIRRDKNGRAVKQRDKDGQLVTKTAVRRGMTKLQEKQLETMYYGNKKEGIPPNTMGATQLYHSFKKLKERAAAKSKVLDIPSKSAIAAWLKAQKLQQTYAPRRSEGQGDVSSFKAASPMVALSMDLANYTRNRFKDPDDDEPKQAKFLDDFGKDGYVLVIVDNFSRYAWTRALNTKKPSEVYLKVEEILKEVRETSEDLRSKWDKDWRKNNPDTNVIKVMHFDDGEEFKHHSKFLLSRGGTFGELKQGKDTDDELFTTVAKQKAMGGFDTLKKIGAFFGIDETTMENHNDNIVGGALQAGTEVVIPESKYKPIKQLTTVGNVPSSNAIVERAIGTLKRILIKMFTIRGGSWRTLLPEATLVYNDHLHRIIGMAPQEAIDLPPDKQGALRTSVKEHQIQDGTETKPPLKVGDSVRLRIGKPTFNSGSKQSYYATVFKVKDVVKSSHPQKAIRYRLEGGKSSAANVKLLGKTYVQRYLLPVDKVEGADKLVKDTLLKTG